MDQAIGESSTLHYYSPVLQAAIDGLFAALAGWRTVAARLARMPLDAVRQEVDPVVRSVPRIAFRPLARCGGALDDRPDRHEPPL